MVESAAGQSRLGMEFEVSNAQRREILVNQELQGCAELRGGVASVARDGTHPQHPGGSGRPQGGQVRQYLASADRRTAPCTGPGTTAPAASPRPLSRQRSGRKKDSWSSSECWGAEWGHTRPSPDASVAFGRREPTESRAPVDPNPVPFPAGLGPIAIFNHHLADHQPPCADIL